MRGGTWTVIAAISASVGSQPAAAQDAAVSADTLGDIVVTARRQSENLQKVPLSATVVDTATLGRTNMTSVKDVQYLSPSLNVSSNTTRSADNYTLRGQGTTFGTDPAVVAYFAEVPMPGGGGGTGMLFDLANVQVLNGPQGTLFGRNTTGGAILFEPQRPKKDLSGYVSLGIGNHGDFAQEAVLNLPLASDKVLLRAGISHRKRDGFTHDAGTGADYDDIDYTTARVSLLVAPTDGFENLTVVNWSDRDENGVGTKLASVNPMSAVGFVFGAAAAAAVADQAALGTRRTRLGVPQRERQKVLTAVNQTRVTLADDLTLKNIASFTRFRSNVTFDNDGSTLPIVDYLETPGWGGPQNNSAPAVDQFTEELQLAGKAVDRHLEWTIGGYYQHNDPRSSLTAQQVFGGPVTLARIGDALTSKAAFGQATFDFGAAAPSLEGLKLTLGYRYTHDRRKDYTDTYLRAGASFDGGGACLYVPGVYPACRVTFAPRNFSASTYTAALSYQASDATLLYATARRGFKSGGFNLGAPPVSTLNSFGPEKVDDVEIGVKTRATLAGVDVRASLAAFRDRYKDIQRALVADFGGGVGVYVVNATAATIKGVELQADAGLTRDLRLGVRYSYLDATYGRFVSPQGDFSGMRLPYTPHHKLALTATYDRDLGGSLGHAVLSAAYAYQSDYRNLDAFDPDVTIAGYALVNLGATWTRIGGTAIDATAYVTNLTGKTYRIGGGNYYYTLGYTTSVYGEPRMFGVKIRYALGG